jgi:hypothetical protein
MLVLMVFALTNVESTPPSDDVVDEVPLIAPIVHPDPKPPEPSIALDRAVHVGVKAIGLAAAGPLSGGTGGAVEIGYRLPFAARRFGVMFEPGFAGLFATGAPAAWWLTLPIGVTYHERAGPGLVRLSAAVAFDLASTVATPAPTRATRDQFWSIGTTIGGGYVIPLGSGGVVIELRYRLLVYLFDDVRRDGHGGTLSVGYSFFL